MTQRTRRIISIYIKKVVCFISIFTLLILFSGCQSGESIVNTVNSVLNINIPNAKVEYFYSSIGGFHGDGERVEILKLNDEQNTTFQNNLDDRWMKLDPKSEIYNYLWYSDTVPGKKAIGGMLNENLFPESDTVFILYDLTDGKINEEINFNDILDFYYVGYSYDKGKIYIQKTNI